MRSGFILAVVFCTLLPGTAVAGTCPALTVRNPAGNYIVPGSLGDVPYKRGLSLDAYVQQGGRERPSVVLIHGGGWNSGSRVAHIGQLIELVTEAGYNWFSIDYRLEGIEGYEDALADLRDALGFIRCRAEDFGIDPAQLLLLGEDAGAHLAALLAAERPEGVLGAVLVGGFYDLTALRLASGLSGPAAKLASPVHRIVRRMPPLLVVHGGVDEQVPAAQAREYCIRVTRAEGRCAFLEVPGASHRAENWWLSQWHYKQDIVEWLSSATHDAPPPSMGYRPRDGAVEKNIVFSQARGLMLDAHLPQGGRPSPAVIIVHGGGWEAGDKVTYVTPLLQPLARAGLAWFSIDYRLTPAVDHPQQLEDVREAIRFLRREHARFGIDPSRVFLLGESASGQMAALIAAEDLSLAGVISFYGVYDFEPMVKDASPRSLLVRLFRRTVLDEPSRELLRKYSPIHHVHGKMPPLLLINGTGERLWDQARAYAGRLKAVGARHELVVLDGAPHGLENWEGRPQWLGYKDRLVDWIQRIAGEAR